MGSKNHGGRRSNTVMCLVLWILVVLGANLQTSQTEYSYTLNEEKN